jgi:hypothetical protein
MRRYTVRSFTPANKVSSDRSPTTKDEDDMALQSAIDELDWHNIVDTPHVQRGLRRLAAEARRKASVGDFEEGGFAVE